MLKRVVLLAFFAIIPVAIATVGCGTKTTTETTTEATTGDAATADK